MVFVSDSPATNKFISNEELVFIESDQKTSESPPADVPWKSLLTSMPFWAILVANFGNNWGFHLLLTELPEFLKRVLKKDIGSNGIPKQNSLFHNFL